MGNTPWISEPLREHRMSSREMDSYRHWGNRRIRTERTLREHGYVEKHPTTKILIQSPYKFLLGNPLKFLNMSQNTERVRGRRLTAVVSSTSLGFVGSAERIGRCWVSLASPSPLPSPHSLHTHAQTHTRTHAHTNSHSGTHFTIIMSKRSNPHTQEFTGITLIQARMLMKCTPTRETGKGRRRQYATGSQR